MMSKAQSLHYLCVCASLSIFALGLGLFVTLYNVQISLLASICKDFEVDFVSEKVLLV